MSVLDTNETYVREKVADYAKERGWLVFIIDYAGWPDRLFVSPKGVHVWIEFKRPKRGRHALRQKHRFGTLQAMGCNVYLVKTVQEGIDVVDLYEA